MVSHMGKKICTVWITHFYSKLHIFSQKKKKKEVTKPDSYSFNTGGLFEAVKNNRRLASPLSTEVFDPKFHKVVFF